MSVLPVRARFSLVQDLKLSVAEVIGRPGEYRDVHLAAPVEGVEVALAHLGPESPIDADLRVESVVEGLLVTGHASARAELECARCLKGFPSTIRTELCELFAASADASEDPDAYPIDGTEIDLEPMLRDALTLALPLNPICDAACRGLCARCGRDLTAGDCSCTDDDVDPRWAELDALRDKLQAG